jgi:HSP20 family molecular chaperone IbpA
MNTVSNHHLQLRPEPAFASPMEDVLAPDFFHALHADVYRCDEEYILEVAVPGMSRDDVKLSIEGEYVIVEAERKSTRVTSDETQLHARHFRRSFLLPADVNIDRITARCANGLLSVVLKRKTNGRQIMIGSPGEKSSTERTSFWQRLKNLMRIKQSEGSRAAIL